MKILFKVSSRSRPEKLRETLENIKSFVQSKDYVICLTLDEDDKTVNNPYFRSLLLTSFPDRIHTFFGRSKNKVDAINRDVSHFQDWDILVNVSDDQRFTVEGFDEIIREKFLKHAPDLDGFLHFRDENHENPMALATMSIIGRKYFERDGFIYDPRFISLWCDNYAQELARRRGKYFFFDQVIFTHLHPAYGKAEVDAQYKKTESYFKRDQAVYNRLMRTIDKVL
jgi:hypothetical protein